MPLLDTGFVIDFLEGDAKAAGLMGLLQQGSAPLGVSPHTIYELYQGLDPDEEAAEEIRRHDDFLRALHVFPFPPEAAKAAGVLQAQSLRRGRALPTMDLLIGCTALHHGEAVVTRNRRDFERIPGLEVLGY